MATILEKAINLHQITQATVCMGARFLTLGDCVVTFLCSKEFKVVTSALNKNFLQDHRQKQYASKLENLIVVFITKYLLG